MQPAITIAAMPSVVQDMRLHFRCEFEISHEGSKQAPFTRVLEEVQKWVLSKHRGDTRGLGGAWFRDTGRWISPLSQRVRIEVDSAHGDAGDQFWAMRYEHPDGIGRDERGSSQRQWRTDISLSTRGESVVFSMQVSHYLLPGHFGPEPAVPDPSSPLLVKNLFQAAGLVTYAGSQPLTARENEVTPDDAELLVERICDKNRRCPLIYVSREFGSGETVLDSNDLAWKLAGLASVYVAESNWLDKETERRLPPEYRCWNGRIRVYLPGVQFDRPNDHRRHRYFTADEVRRDGAQEITRIIVQSLARRIVLSSAAGVANIDDVRLKKQEQEFARLKNQLATAPPAEMMELLESINKELEHKYRTAEAEKATLAERLEFAELETQERDDEISRLRYQEKEQREDALAQRQMRSAAEDRLKKFSGLTDLPESILECCHFFAAAFPDRVAFTQRALDAAGRSDFPKVNAVWNALWHMVSTLHPLAFDAERQIDVEDEFRARSGIEMSFNEGSQTKGNSKLMRSRAELFEGESIDITPHVKLQTGNKYFRFYFHIHRKKRILVVGDCGHLDTAGTSKRK
ncbi:MAG: hypothetical protein JST93_34565 [Acidobacteria bacterium]|nr:hypothetical protein [Acidobacteriota bacterium]